MYSFEGNYKRAPIQNYMGASHNFNRDQLIKKAQEERQKRAEIRRQNNGATIIQSHVRSFLVRQAIKQEQRHKFDETNRKSFECLTHVEFELQLKRLLFFYYKHNLDDANRLIYICQFLIRTPNIILQLGIEHRIWTFRLKKLLFYCTEQICTQHLLQAIPFRMLEIFSSEERLQKYINNLLVVRKFTEELYTYLIRRKYFKLVREMLEQKVPPLDDKMTKPPTPICNTLLQMLLQPLHLIGSSSMEYSELIMSSFIEFILAREFTDCIHLFVLPALSCNDFPYLHLIQYLSNYINKQDNQRKLELKKLIENKSHRLMGSDGGGNSSNSSGSSSSSSSNSGSNVYTGDDLRFIPPHQQETILTSFLFNSFLTLSQFQMEFVQNTNNLSAYIKIIASMSTLINRLQPKRNSNTNKYKISRNPEQTTMIYNDTKYDADENNNSDSDSNDSSQDEDVEITYNNNNNNNNHQIMKKLTIMEREALLEIVRMLNDILRTKNITDNIEMFLNDSEVMHSVCKICHHLMMYHRLAIYEYSFLYMLAFKPKFIRQLWFLVTSQSSLLGFSSPISLLSKGIYIPKHDTDRVIPILATFCTLFGRLLSTLYDGEFSQENLLPGEISKIMPFSLSELIPLSSILKSISLGLVELAFPETRSSINEHYRSVLRSSENIEAEENINKTMWPHLLKVCVSLLRQLHTRDLRCGYCPENHWTVQTLNLPLDKPTDLHLNSNRHGIRPFQPIRDFTKEDFASDGPPLSTKQVRSITILREIPFVVSFNSRVGILQGLMSADKLRSQGDLQEFQQGPSIHVSVRRSHLYEDAYDNLRPENAPDLRSRFRVQMINNVGLEEVGIDGGGVFREFLSELIKAAFDPNRGFFKITTDNKLYPNPSVGKIIEDFHKHYYFIGRILGKALYENLLVELPLADFFLSKLAGKHSDVDVHQLASLDPELHRNLLSLKAYEGDVSELGLDFTIVSDELGETIVHELKPNGSNIIVNSTNRIEYIGLMADYKLNKQIRKQCNAFRMGLANTINIEWLYMFSNKEFQVLISGAEIPVDIEDLKRNTRYGGDYEINHLTIKLFWNVLENFTDIQRRQLLKFVTSCSRPPLLGFRDLDPPFCIQNAGDTDRLPSASTCMNLLKLPAFNNEEQLREKLLYAIQSGAGFELS